MDRNSNGYTFLFAAIMVIVVGALLAFAATSLKDLQDENVKKEKMQNILASVGVVVEREQAPSQFTSVIKEQLALKIDGSVDETTKAFEIDLKNELSKKVEDQRFPLYVAEQDGKKFYIVPLRGAGLWDAIWGYVALEEDLNTIKGTVFDHKGETPGLGAEITQKWFQDRFVGEKILNQSGEIVGVAVAKGNTDPSKEDNKVDAISGATITGDGVTNMIKERLSNYKNYFANQKKLALNK
ncbi:Na(+)-translocating NADH-quinone reductase subunit C [Flavobacterium piscinae]|jgi:Na+-transporting NADH:ubiquinone oxidoreductase subunit C|uniref:Na(+)-translocating NADH-quinone reductase subunit C n=1 Tax=Flavobacterium piscinae TaxID=2506424 RepID=A0A4Q1KJV5_9FLAO|nr:Na(+)-translocating NADH-quinone reductase subunit C [Flavobacterium piscinae]RXR29675.1 Na(+)-translocating NADH-quinone reductase subunit C [Flavobacterium piscinae]